MNKKVIIGLTMLLLLSLGAVGTFTWTYFTDTETQTGNFFQAGTLDLEVDNLNPWTSGTITVANLQPGSGSGVSISVENVGTIDGALYMRYTNAIGSGSVTSEPECSAEGGAWTSPSGPCVGNTPVDDVDNRIAIGTSYASVPVGSLSGSLSGWSGAATSWVLLDNDFNATDTDTIVVSGTLSASAGNVYQGDQATFDIELSLVQDGQTP